MLMLKKCVCLSIAAFSLGMSFASNAALMLGDSMPLLIVVNNNSYNTDHKPLTLTSFSLLPSASNPGTILTIAPQWGGITSGAVVYAATSGYDSIIAQGQQILSGAVNFNLVMQYGNDTPIPLQIDSSPIQSIGGIYSFSDGFQKTSSITIGQKHETCSLVANPNAIIVTINCAENI